MGVRDPEFTGIPPGVRTEALECAQLAAAFAGAICLLENPAGCV